MAWFLGQSLIFLVLAFLLGMLVGWMVWGRGDRSLATRPESAPLASFFAPAGGSESAVVIHEPEPMRVPRPGARIAAAERARSIASQSKASERAPLAAVEPAPDAMLATTTGPANHSGTPDGSSALDVPSALDVSGAPAGSATGEPTGEQPELILDGAAGADPAGAPPQDDLQRIEGIGPKISSVLVASGVRTYQQLADLDRLTLTETLSTGGVKFAPSLATWAEQAQLLARGDEAGFLELAGRLLSDRRAR